MQQNEKRRTRRIEHIAPVEVKVQSCPGFHDLEGRKFSATTRDASETGLRLILDSALPVNTFLELNVLLGDTRYLLTGRVVWSSLIDAAAAHTGIIFTEEAESRMASWKNHLSRVLAGGK